MSSSLWWQILVRDLRLNLHGRNQWLNPLSFFVMVVTLFPLAVGPSPQQLSLMAPGVVWVAALLAVMLSLDTLFRSDYEDGSLEQLLLSASPLYGIVLAKVFAYWLVIGLPLVLLAPVLALMLSLPMDAVTTLVLSLLLGTPTLVLVGGIGAALTVALRKGGVLLALLVLPLYIPVLIFGSAAVQAAMTGMASGASLSMLAAFLAAAIALAPLAMSAGLRISVSQ